jgi:hypothetical protein
LRQKKLRPKPVGGSLVPGVRGMGKRGEVACRENTINFYLPNVVNVETVVKKVKKVFAAGFS